MDWQPLNEVYFVRPNKLEVSKLILEKFEENHAELRTGVVTHRGTGVLLESNVRAPLQANIGDTVMFGSKVGTKIVIDGENLLVLAEPNVLAVKYSG